MKKKRGASGIVPFLITIALVGCDVGFFVYLTVRMELKHAEHLLLGNPSSVIPAASKNETGPSAKPYGNERLALEMQYPENAEIEEYGPYKTKTEKLGELLVVSGKQSERKVLWTVGVWGKNAAVTTVATDIVGGLTFLNERAVRVGNMPAALFTFKGPDQAGNGGEKIFRVFVADGGSKWYALSSELCNDGQVSACSDFISNFKTTGKGDVSSS